MSTGNTDKSVAHFSYKAGNGTLLDTRLPKLLSSELWVNQAERLVEAHT